MLPRPWIITRIAIVAIAVLFSALLWWRVPNSINLIMLLLWGVNALVSWIDVRYRPREKSSAIIFTGLTILFIVIAFYRP